MKSDPASESLPPTDPSETCSSNNCGTGTCGGRGLCPGIAFFIAYAIGGGIAWLSGLNWLGWAVGIPLALVLISGVWRLLPGIPKRPSEVHGSSGSGDA